MLKKLRRKFILITMSMITVVLLAVFAASIFSTYQGSFNSMRNALEEGISVGDRQMSPEVGGRVLNGFIFSFGDELFSDPSDIFSDTEGDKKESPVKNEELQSYEQDLGAFIPVYTVIVNEDYEIVSQVNPYVVMDEDLLSQAVDSAQQQGDSEGYLKGLSLYYLKAESKNNNTILAFADSTNVTDPLWSTVKTSLLIGVCAWIAFLAVIILLSRIVLRPVEEAWERQRQFVADASHELKTPLTIMLANNQILLSSPEKTVGEQKKWVVNSQEEAERMERLIDNLLYLAQMEEAEAESEDQITPPHEPVDLSEATEKCLLQFEAIAFDRKITLESKIEPGVIVEGEADQLERLVKILVDNACKYAEEKGTITVNLSKTGEVVTLSVTNTGSFIKEDEVEQIFERFYRSDESRTRATGDETAGYGLGLSIAQSIVKAQKGTIKAQSQEGKTTFKVTLPTE